MQLVPFREADFFAIMTRFMPQDPQTQTAVAQVAGMFPPPPPIPSGEEVYDKIMSGIEVDLTTSQLPLLKEKYQGETPEEARARAERYQKAFAEYDRQYALYVQTQEQALAAYKQQFTKGIQTIEQSNDASQLDQLSSAIQSL